MEAPKYGSKGASTGRRSGSGQRLKFESDKEAIEYYIDALYEALVLCISKGFSEQYILELDVFGFTDVYKFVRRISAREDMKMLAIVNHAMGASKDDAKKFQKYLSEWLPVQEQARPVKVSNPFEFVKKLNSGKR